MPRCGTCLAPRRPVRAVALLNLGGGTLSRGAAHPGEVASALRHAGLFADVRVVPGPLLAGATRQAVAEGVELVIAGGGDGTISAVAGAIAGSEASLGVLPLGTFNHYARDLGVPPALREAAVALAASSPHALDLAEVNGHRFVNNSALGFYTKVVRERAEPRVRSKLGKARSTAIAALRLLGKYRLSEVCLEVDGARIDRRTPFVFISNNAAELHALSFGRRNRLDGGKLLVYVHRNTSRRAVLRTMLAALIRDVRLTSARFDEWLTDAVEIDFPGRRRPVAVFKDGELLHLPAPLRYRILAGKLRVLVPPGSTAAAASAA